MSELKDLSSAAQVIRLAGGLAQLPARALVLEVVLGFVWDRRVLGCTLSALCETPSSACGAPPLTGYPLEVHEVVTADGYKLRMERLPSAGAVDVVLFMHGILDTSLTWVGGSVRALPACLSMDFNALVERGGWAGTGGGNALLLMHR